MGFKNFIVEHGVKVECTKNCQVFTQGEPNESVYLLMSGLLKASFVTSDGKEHIKSFIVEGNIICSLTAAYKKKLNMFSLVAIQDSILFEVSFDTVMNAAITYPEIGKEIIEMLIHLSMKKEQREYEFLSMSAEERLCQLYKVKPSLIEKVTQKDLALYLGITPVAISRIKQRVFNDYLREDLN